MANILDLAERFIESKSCMAENSKGVVAWGIKNGLVKQAPLSKGTEYNWQLSRRIKRLEADKLRHQNRIKEILSK